MTDKPPPRVPPPLTGTLFENTRRIGPEDCCAYGFARLAGKSYRIKVYEFGTARGEPGKRRWARVRAGRGERG